MSSADTQRPDTPAMDSVVDARGYTVGADQAENSGLSESDSGASTSGDTGGQRAGQPAGTGTSTAGSDGTAVEETAGNGSADGAEGDARDNNDLAAESGDEASAEQAEPDVEIDMEQLVAERDTYLDRWQRATADLANFKRQTERRNADVVARAASKLVKDLLPVLDACEAAASHGVEGIEAVQSQLLGVLGSAGLSVVGTVGEAFDPTFHEAVLAEPSDDDDADGLPVVSDIFRTGYAWKGQVLRAAMVKVKG